jgi:putative endonuclease
MYYVYILKSKKTGRYYTGYTTELETRLERHNSGHTKSTKAYRPWELVYSEEYSTRSEAMHREYSIKSRKSRKYIEYLIKSQ